MLDIDENEEKSSTRVYSYIRVSGKGQVDKDGPERQRDAIAAFCKSHKLDCVGEAFERGVSGTVESTERPAFSDMLERIPNYAVNGIVIDGIVVERVDRLARDLMVSELLLGECRKRNIKVFAADQGVLINVAENDGDPTRKLIRQIMGALAEWEKSVLVRKLRLSRERKKAITGRCDGNKFFGHFPREKDTLRYVEALLAQTPRPSYQQLADSLNLAGLFKRNGTAWKREEIFRILQHSPKK